MALEKFAALLNSAVESSGWKVPVALKIVTFVCAALTVCEWIDSLDFEVSAIWPKRACIAKWQYLGGRYLGLLGHIFNIIAYTSFYGGSSTIPWGWCYTWHLFALQSNYMLILLLEVTTAIQVRVLWGRSVTMTLLLILLVGSGFVANTIVGVKAFKDIHLLDTCELGNIPIWAIAIPTTKAFTQIVLWILTMIKCTMWKADLVSLVIKQSSITSSILTVILLGALVVLNSAEKHSVLAQKAYPFIYPIFLTLVSTLVCRSTQRIYTYSASSQNPALVDSDETVTSSGIFSTIISDYWWNNSLDEELEL